MSLCTFPASVPIPGLPSFPDPISDPTAYAAFLASLVGLASISIPLYTPVCALDRF